MSGGKCYKQGLADNLKFWTREELLDDTEEMLIFVGVIRVLSLYRNVSCVLEIRTNMPGGGKLTIPTMSVQIVHTRAGIRAVTTLLFQLLCTFEKDFKVKVCGGRGGTKEEESLQ